MELLRAFAVTQSTARSFPVVQSLPYRSTVLQKPNRT